MVGYAVAHSTCVIAEPQTHVHPTLQQALLREIVRIADERHIQVLSTTHSAAMINFVVSHPSMRLFEANGWKFRTFRACVQVVDVQPSKLCLANGLVWVEGPSDRVYLLHWLTLRCMQHQEPVPTENIDFEFAYYGGAFCGITRRALARVRWRRSVFPWLTLLMPFMYGVHRSFQILLRVTRRGGKQVGAHKKSAPSRDAASY